MTFASMLVRLGVLALRLGIEEIVFTWDLRGWSPSAPNEGRRWSVQCGQVAANGAVGQEALANVLEAAESIP